MNREKAINQMLVVYAFLVVMLVSALVLAPRAYALDPTELEPAEGLEPGTIEIEQEVQYQETDDYQAESETSIEYELTEHSALKLTIPVEKEEGEDTEVEAGLRYKYVFNPNAERAPIVAASVEALVPIEGDGDCVDGEAGLYVSKALGGDDSKHQLHLNLLGHYENDAEAGERDMRYKAIAGYGYQATPKTSLVADVVREQLEDSGENANIVEFGVKHEFNDTFAASLGVGAGIGEESPDFTARAGFSLKFGSKR